MNIFRHPPTVRTQLWSRYVATSTQAQSILRSQNARQLSDTPRVEFQHGSRRKYPNLEQYESENDRQARGSMPSFWKDDSKNKPDRSLVPSRSDQRSKQRQTLRHPVTAETAAPQGVVAKTNKTSKLGKKATLSKSPNSHVQRRESIELVDVAYVRRTMVLPTPEEYPNAPKTLFNPAQIANALHDRAQALGQLLSVTTKFSVPNTKPKEDRPSSRSRIRTCEVKVTFGDSWKETAIGQGKDRAAAKAAALLYVVSKLHSNGSLRKLYQDENAEDDEFAIAKLDQSTMSAEKSAKHEIYNFAASLGLVPEFEMHDIDDTLRQRLRRRGRNLPKSAKKASIKIPGLNVEVSMLGKNDEIAELAACLAMKRHLEGTAHTIGEARKVFPDLSRLAIETATQFLKFLKSTRSDIRIDVGLLPKPQNQSQATISINGQALNHHIQSGTKGDVLAIANLVAAVEICTSNNDVYREFVAALNAGGGKILQNVHDIRTQLSPETLKVMRGALAIATRYGLAAENEALPAESSSGNDLALRRRPGLTAEKRADISQNLKRQLNSYQSNAAFEKLRESRAALPMSQYSSQVIDMVTTNPQSIVVGATGSGKTTQVPQLILDDAIRRNKGGFCDIICTQPRRIAASSVARRVADERGQALQESVGYHVRFDAKLPRPGGSITFCTTGILLEQLKHDSDHVLDRTSHLVLDEVHERDMNVDILLINLKKAIKTRQAEGKRVPKIVLMSATIDTKLFANYFSTEINGKKQPCPSISVPGRTFPVADVFLQDIYSDIKDNHAQEFDALISRDPVTKDFIAAETEITSVAPNDGEFNQGPIDWKRRANASSNEHSQDHDTDVKVPIALVAATVARVVETAHDGAVLVFLPGLDDIVKARKLLEERPIFGIDFTNTRKFKLMVLHSSVPADQQKEIFDPTPPGCRKIILSTNIAETSVTVPDVQHVVDTGLMRESRYDQLTRMTKLECVWVSASNARQRAGRAGRVSRGTYYALYSRERQGRMRASVLPELLRSDLSEVCLSIKAQGYKEPLESLLNSAIEPPSTSAIGAAINTLTSLQAFTETEELTILGRILSKLPVHPSLSKMIILGIIFRCLDPVMTLGSIDPSRSIFAYPLGCDKSAVKRMHRDYQGELSDHFAALKAVRELRAIETRVGYSAARERAMDRFLHWGVYRDISNTSRQIEVILKSTGLIPDVPWDGAYGGAGLNLNSKYPELIKALMLAGLNPNFAVKNSFSNARLHRTLTEENVLFPTTSENAVPRVGQGPGSLYCYSVLGNSQQGQFFARSSTLVSPLMALLFGGNLHAQSYRTLEMDKWLRFGIWSPASTSFATNTVFEFRDALDKVLNRAFEILLTDKSGILGHDALLRRFTDDIVNLLQHNTDYKPLPHEDIMLEDTGKTPLARDISSRVRQVGNA